MFSFTQTRGQAVISVGHQLIYDVSRIEINARNGLDADETISKMESAGIVFGWRA